MKLIHLKIGAVDRSGDLKGAVAPKRLRTTVVGVPVKLWNVWNVWNYFLKHHFLIKKKNVYAFAISCSYHVIVENKTALRFPTPEL